MNATKKVVGISLLIAGSFGFGQTVSAITLDLNSFNSVTRLVEDRYIVGLEKTVGFGTQHRAFASAHPLGIVVGLNLGAEFDYVHIPNDFRDALTVAGYSKYIPTDLPIAKINLRKGLGSRLDVGLSGIGYASYRIIGGDAQLALWQPDSDEGGVEVAGRLAYTHTQLGILDTDTWSPQIVVSKKIEIFDPYIGFGWESTSGTISIRGTVQGVTLDLKGDANASGVESFIGTAMQLGPSGIRIALQGEYNSAGCTSIGVWAGLGL